MKQTLPNSKQSLCVVFLVNVCVCVCVAKEDNVCSFDRSLLMVSLFTMDAAEPTLEDTTSLTTLSNFFHLNIPITCE